MALCVTQYSSMFRRLISLFGKRPLRDTYRSLKDTCLLPSWVRTRKKFASFSPHIKSTVFCFWEFALQSTRRRSSYARSK